MHTEHPTEPVIDRGRESRPIKVLMYHRLIEDEVVGPSERKFCTHVNMFRRHLDLIERSGFTPITFNDYHLCCQGELNLPGKPIIITFDDGYLDTFELGYPLLMEYGMKAVVFVIADQMIKTNSWDSGDGIPPTPLMSASQIVELHSAGFEIGSHTLTHPRLTQLDRGGAWEEISRSRMLLEILTNGPIRTFSYPFGLLNDNVRALVKEAGYQFACGVYSGPPSFASDIFNIRRITPSNDPLSLGFYLQIHTPIEKFSWMKWMAKQYFFPKVKEAGYSGDPQ